MSDTRPSTTTLRYTRVAIALHWIIALLIVVNLVGGVAMERLLDSPDPLLKQQGFVAIQGHKAIGITILTLSVLRVLWRATHRPPPQPPGLHAWERILSHGVHHAFYVLIIAVPLLGYIGVSTSILDFPISWFGLFEVPQLPLATDKTGAERTLDVHGLLAFTMAGLVVLHIAGAFKHAWSPADVLPRMMP